MSQNLKPHRLTPCRRHPNLQTTTGLCGPCLHDRLSLLTPAATELPPELRRCNTFSGKNSVVLDGEPRRRSCDVNLENNAESRKLGLTTCAVPEAVNEDDDEDESVLEAKVEIVRVSNLGNNEVDFEEGKTMKEFIDLELETNCKLTNNRKDFKEFAGSFLGAASIFSKKLRKWRNKPEVTANDSDCNRNSNSNRVDVSLGELRLEDLRGRRLSYTQSEVGDYGLGRRSCDTDVVLGRASVDCGAFGRKSCDSDPRFSIDLGRASVDESKSEVVDTGRALWDGGRTGNVVSVIENAMASVYGFDDRGLGDGMVKVERGFDRCSSVRREAVVMSGDGEVGLSNAKVVSPAAIGIFNGTKLLITEKELNEWRLKSLKDDSSESFDTASKDLGSVSSSSVGKDEKKCRQWSKLWSFLGLVNRRKGGKFGDEDEPARASAASPKDMQRDGNKRLLLRSYSTSSSRGSSSVVGLGTGTNYKADSKAIVKRRQDDGFLQRNRSTRYSPNDIDSGLLRFYLTPLRSRRRNRSGKSRLRKSHSLARSVLKL